jgi:hypothetical protein
MFPWCFLTMRDTVSSPSPVPSPTPFELSTDLRSYVREGEEKRIGSSGVVAVCVVSGVPPSQGAENSSRMKMSN